MSENCDLNILETSLNTLRNPLTDGRKRAAFHIVKNAPKEEVAQAWQKVRAIETEPGWELDCLQRVAVQTPDAPIECERALVLVLGPGFEQMCEWMLETLQTFGDTPEAQVILFCIDGSYQRLSGIENRVPNVTRIRCRSVEKINAAVKGVLYSVARWVKAKAIIALECDMLVLDSLQPLWSLVEQAQPLSLMGCAPGGNPHRRSVSREVSYGGSPLLDLEWLTGIVGYDTKIWFNGGLLAGKYDAWRELDRIICGWMPYCALWIEGFLKPFGDEMVTNLAIGLMPERVTLPAGWNVQSFTAFRQIWFRTTRTAGQVSYAHTKGEPAHILHFAGGAKPVMRDVFYELLLNVLAKRERETVLSG